MKMSDIGVPLIDNVSTTFHRHYAMKICKSRMVLNILTIKLFNGFLPEIAVLNDQTSIFKSLTILISQNGENK